MAQLFSRYHQPTRGPLGPQQETSGAYSHTHTRLIDRQDSITDRSEQIRLTDRSGSQTGQAHRQISLTDRPGSQTDQAHRQARLTDRPGSQTDQAHRKIRLTDRPGS